MVDAGRRATAAALYAERVAPHESGWDPTPLLMFSPRFIAACLANAFLDGVWTEKRLVARATKQFDPRPRGLRALVRRVMAMFPDPSAMGIDALADWILRKSNFSFPEVKRIRWSAPAMQPTAEVIRGWNLPTIASPGQLADWLGLTIPQLDWFADVRHRNRHAPPGSLRHYTYHVLRKSGGRIRLLEAPKPKLKFIQRRILHDLLAHVPAHPAVHGFRPGRSVVSYAAPHVGKAMVLRMDLADFFVSIKAARIRALFRTFGYPREVAHLLTGLCTHATPEDAWPTGVSSDNWTTRRRHADPHLPQGAPTSPALANLCAYRLDLRLSALAESVSVSYTRYADDLAFSGGPEFARAAGRFRILVGQIVMDENFEVNWKKTRRMRPSIRQRLAGVVVNQHPNVPRDDYDRLKAILHNCRKHEPQAQNRAKVADFRAHLLGRVAHMISINPGRGAKLRAMFEGIEWDSQ